MIAILRTIVVVITTVVYTIVLGVLAIGAAFLNYRDRPGGIYDFVPRTWSKLILATAGVKLHIHNLERARAGSPRIFVANHVSWFDVPTLASFLPWPKFVAKSELFKVPVFGWAIKSVGMVELQRDNRKAAFESYKFAAAQIQKGTSVVVFPEGTRGVDYSIRQFKKGPFVLAIAAGVPIVPIVTHGTMETIRKHELIVRSGRVDVHLLEPIPTAGLGYSDRDELMATVRDRMAEAMRELYGVDSLPTRIRIAKSSEGESASTTESNETTE
ncbi:MAG: 1-acyl-sn-glycerol-3-phosphate acyltransferase [Gemmatimonadaceae bacterium]|nr:1-acyl-sn-glycerol-3-phosphate acyltransferase [Gemmatimonadaceae bacterium]